MDMWKDGTELVHLEWPDCAEELTAVVCPQTRFDTSARITAVDMSADAIQAAVETGAKNAQAILKMASASDHYKSIPVERLQDMATHGLIFHPTQPQPDFLTCDHYFKKGTPHLLAQC